MHMHCHLRSCVFDFGPLHGFWLYPFERYNGLLGAMSHNNHSIEVQIMSRFLRDNEVFGTYLPEEFSGDFLSLFPKQNQTVRSLADTLVYTEQSGSVIWAINSPGLSVDLPTHYSHLVFDQTELDTLTILYSKLYKVPASAVVLSSVTHKYSSATINNKRFGTHKTRTSSSSLAMAIWDNELFGLSPTMPTTPAAASKIVLRAVRINSFFKNVIEINGESKAHLLVSLSWFRHHPKNTELGKTTTVWYHDLFELYGLHSVIPIQFLQSRVVSLIQVLEGESVLFLCPCIDH